MIVLNPAMVQTKTELQYSGSRINQKHKGAHSSGKWCSVMWGHRHSPRRPKLKSPSPAATLDEKCLNPHPLDTRHWRVSCKMTDLPGRGHTWADRPPLRFLIGVIMPATNAPPTASTSLSALCWRTPYGLARLRCPAHLRTMSPLSLTSKLTSVPDRWSVICYAQF